VSVSSTFLFKGTLPVLLSKLAQPRLTTILGPDHQSRDVMVGFRDSVSWSVRTAPGRHPHWEGEEYHEAKLSGFSA
jgi:hypothetical protein